MQKVYWQFYWPLTLTGIAALVAKQCENAVLARYPNAAEELAVFAYGWSCFMLIEAALIFVPQTVTRLARTPAQRRVCFRFIVVVCLFLTLLVAAAGFTALGARVIAQLFDLTSVQLDLVRAYLRFLTPLTFINGMSMYYVGLLVLQRRTGAVTLMQCVFLGVSVALLFAGLNLGWAPLTTMVVSQLAGAAVKYVIGFIGTRTEKVQQTVMHDSDDDKQISSAQVFAFFWPVALTSIMFAVSRPILYSFLSRTASAIVTVAVLRVTFDLAMLFHNPANQSRHLLVTFGTADRSGMQIFLTRIMLGLSAIMILFVATPLLPLFTRNLLGLNEQMTIWIGQAFWPMAFLPIAITVRNMVHGTAMIRKKTNGMGAGGVARNITVYAAAALCWRLGVLDHVSAAVILVGGFIAETLVTLVWLRVFDKVDDPVLRLDFAGALGFGRA